MKVFEILKTKKIFFLQIFLTLYIGINLIGGERGLVSYSKKNTYEKKLFIQKSKLQKKLELTENKNELLSKNIDFDYMDILYRTKLNLVYKTK